MPTGLNIGMSVPGASSMLGDDPSLSDQVAGETAEQRKKRLLAQAAAKQLPVGMTSLGGGYGDALTMK